MTDEPKPALKPCPFCGAVAEFATTPESYGYTSEEVYVKCSTCWVATPREATEAWAQGLGHYNVRAQAFGMVAEQWNARA